MSTVGTASATESHVGDDSRTQAGEQDEDMYSTDTNYREADSVASVGGEPEAMDEDINSHGAYDDRMSDDGSASLVGFGEGAGSTVSGPIYHRRPIPGQQTGILERTNSGMSDVRRERDAPMGGGDTPLSAAAVQERRDARAIDGIAADQHHNPNSSDQNAFVDTTLRGPVPVGNPQGREAAENIVRRLDHGESRVGPEAMSSPGRGQALGKFYFEGGDK